MQEKQCFKFDSYYLPFYNSKINFMNNDYYLESMDNYKNERAKEILEANNYSMNTSEIEEYRTQIVPYMEKYSTKKYKVVLTNRQLEFMKYHENKVVDQQKAVFDMQLFLANAVLKSEESSNDSLHETEFARKVEELQEVYRKSLGRAISKFRESHIEKIIEKNIEYSEVLKVERSIKSKKEFISALYGITEIEQPIAYFHDLRRQEELQRIRDEFKRLFGQ